ncbi:MAG: PEP-CTERM sorting domain-containing protein [Leptospirales bacterium]
MKKMGIMRKIALATGVAVAVSAGVSMNVGLASADTYLGAPSITLTNPGGSAFAFNVSSTSGSFTAYDTPSSSYGDTIPTAAALNAAGIPGTINSISGQNGPVLYDPTPLALTQINSITDNYTGTASNGSTFTGQIISNVFKVTSGGSGIGDLVFSYQFDVTSVAPPGNGINGLSISFFNEPLNLNTGVGTPWVLGDGINRTPVGSVLSGTPLSLASVNGSVTYDPVDGTFYSLAYSSTTSITSPSVSPQFFVASNATNYAMGSLSFQGGGAGLPGQPVFVPGVPEPSTLALLGTGLALLAFVAFRKRQNLIAI